jgi:hypothetical protein
MAAGIAALEVRDINSRTQRDFTDSFYWIGS